MNHEYEMLYSRGSLAVTALGDSVYAIGGFNSKEALQVVEVMDVRNNKWRSLSTMSTERAYGEAAVIGEQVRAHYLPSQHCTLFMSCIMECRPVVTCLH